MVPKEETIPQVFLSHASEDKDRFARKLAEEFHNNGIKCWFDEWEMGPGDSLFEMINKGIHESGYFVVVISNNSISKPWVQHELAAAYSKLVSNKVKLIPLILDNLSIDSLPPLLADIIHCNFSDSSRFDIEFTKVKNTILGISQKPPLKKVSHKVHSTGFRDVLSEFDLLVFNSACNIVLSKNALQVSIPVLLLSLDSAYSIDDINNSLEYLAEINYIEIIRLTGSVSTSFVINQAAFYEFLSREFPDFDAKLKNLLELVLVVGPSMSNTEIADQLNLPKIVVSTVFFIFKASNLIDVIEYIGDTQYVTSVSQKLKRELQNW